MNQKNLIKKEKKRCLKCDKKFCPTAVNPWLCESCYKANSHIDENLATPRFDTIHGSEKIIRLK